MHVRSDQLGDLARSAAQLATISMQNQTRVSLSASWGFEPRLIPDHFLCLILRGQATATGPDGTHRLGPGGLILAGPELPHGMAACEGPLRLTAFRFSTADLQPGLWWVGPGYPEVAQDLGRLYELDPVNPSQSPADSLAWQSTLAMVLARQARHAGRSRRQIPGPLRAARARLDAAPTERLSVAEMAASVGWSASHFSRAFRQAYGVAPAAYLIRRRCEHAATLLDAGASVQDVASACDYPDAYTFSRQFHQVMGLPPSRWLARI